MSHISQFVNKPYQDLECPCTYCGHDKLQDCVREDCQCCNLEDTFYMLTGVYIEEGR
jgi:hypothetical protein